MSQYDKYEKYEVVIGLEIHAQLNTKSKAFCGDSTVFGAQPNTHISPISLAHPGTLPRMNKEHIKKAAKLGLATNCTIQQVNYFDRKNYFYPDLPKGYQTTQDNQPICINGYVPVRMTDSIKSVRLNRIHMEEDAGKSVHDLHPTYSLIDLNRAGVPLLEIVSEPDLRSAEEAGNFVATIRRLVRYLDVCDGNMEEGSLRCDCNVSVRLKGKTTLGTRCEIKNVNSISNVKTAIAYEANRQIDLLEAGEPIVQQTRTFHAETGTTSALRSKENAHDYRYFPEPDLAPIVISDEQIAAWQSEMPALPEALFQQFTEQYQLSTYDTNLLIDDREMALYYLEIIKYTKNHKAAANWLINSIRSYLNDAGLSITEFTVLPEQIANLIQLIDDEKIGNLAAKQQVFPTLIQHPQKSPLEIAQMLNVIQEEDNSLIEDLVQQIIVKYPEQVEEYRSTPDNKKGSKRKKGLLSLFVGELMKESRGKANPKIVTPILMKALETLN
jgi:aspartyl-tRNA(Asn)/glutamyl-tRNA(Gln) amidotransferase subunit B